MADSNSVTNEERLLNSIVNGEPSNVSPITRQEHYLSAIAGETELPAKMQAEGPLTREEIYYQKILDNGGGGGGGGDEPTGTKNISITQNGVTTENVKTYASAKITTNVPNSYGASDEGKVVDNGELVAQTSQNIDTNDTYDTTLVNEVVVNVPNSYSASDEGKVVDDGALVAQTSKSIGVNGTYNTTTNDEVVVSVPNSYSASDEGKVVSNGALVSQTSDTVTTNDTYDTTLINSLTVNVSGGGLPFTFVKSLIVHDGNAFDFGITIDPSVDQILLRLGIYATTGEKGVYNSWTGSTFKETFFSVRGRNSGYNRWNYNGYYHDNVNTSANGVVISGNVFGDYSIIDMKVNKKLKGDGSDSTGTATQAYPQTETLLHVGSGWDGKEFYQFGIYKSDTATWRCLWNPALDADGVPCFYDSVSKNFIYNTGTGDVGYVYDGVTYDD